MNAAGYATASPPASHTRHLAALDGLRGIAIALVMVYHFWLITWFPTQFSLGPVSFNIDVYAQAGMTGVTLFFFISGFCLFYPYAQTLFDGREPQTVSMFAYRRMLKILPSYYVGIALWIALGFAQFSSHDDAVRQVLTHVFFVHGFWSDTNGSINGVLWSLATEVQFYVLFPAIAWIFMRKPLWTFVAMVVIGNVYRFGVVNLYDSGRLINLLPGTIDVFGAGMLAAWLFRYVSVKRPEFANRKAIATVVAAVGLFALYLSIDTVYNHRSDEHWGERWYLYGVPSIAFSMTILTLGSLFAYRWWQAALANPVLLLLSYLSYNLYLWHQILAFWLTKLDLTAFRPSTGGFDPSLRVLYTWMFVGLAMGVAWLLTTFLEQPLLRLRPLAGFFAPRSSTRAESVPRDVAELAAP